MRETTLKKKQIPTGYGLRGFMEEAALELGLEWLAWSKQAETGVVTYIPDDPAVDSPEVGKCGLCIYSLIDWFHSFILGIFILWAVGSELSWKGSVYLSAISRLELSVKCLNF